MVGMDVMENDANVVVKHIFSAIKNGVRASEPGSDAYTLLACLVAALLLCKGCPAGGATSKSISTCSNLCRYGSAACVAAGMSISTPFSNYQSHSHIIIFVSF